MRFRTTLTAILGGLLKLALMCVVRIYVIAAMQQERSLGRKVRLVNPLSSPVFATMCMMAKEMSFVDGGFGMADDHHFMSKILVNLLRRSR